jgi:acetylornithine deacetylase/succinyl-diaminopimelate desuccinylase-like protein
MLEKITETVDDPRVSFEIITAREAEVSPGDDPAYWALVNQIQAVRPDAVVGPIISPGFTDSVFLRKKGVHAYGLAPYMLPETELLGMHGDNERISLENVSLGLRILWGAVLELAADPKGKPTKD